MQMKSNPWWLWIIPIALLLFATALLPYGYYTFTRLVVCGFAVFLALVGWRENSAARVWSALFAIAAILFNPIIPIYLHRGTWFYLDVGVAAFLAAHLAFVRIGPLQRKSP